jgi:hypothetical protein
VVRAGTGRGGWLLPAVLLLTTAAPSIAAARGAGDPVPGSILYAARPTTVRTRGGGNLSVDLPRGRAVVIVDLGPDSAVLAPAPPDAETLRTHGVRRMPRYTASRAQIAADFLTAEAWASARREGMLQVRQRFASLTDEQAERVFLGEPWIGMTEELAEETLGALVLARGPVAGRGSATAWTVGRRTRSAELRVYTEARERGARARSFDEYLKSRIRATLTFEDGLLVAIDPPEGVTPGLNWP